jgi:hypothetical protein
VSYVSKCIEGSKKSDWGGVVRVTTSVTTRAVTARPFFLAPPLILKHPQPMFLP